MQDTPDITGAGY